MKKSMLAAALLGLLGACGTDGTGGGDFTTGVMVGGGLGQSSGVVVSGNPGGGAPNSLGNDALYSLSVSNYDAVDYALWIQSQDALGNQNQNFVAFLPAAPLGSSSQIVQDVPVSSGLLYTVLLLDPSGTLWDSFPLGTPNSGDLVAVTLSVVGGTLLPG